MPKISVRVDHRDDRIHIRREGSRIGAVINFDEIEQVITDLEHIRDTWPLRRQVEREHDARLTGSQR